MGVSITKILAFVVKLEGIALHRDLQLRKELIVDASLESTAFVCG